MKPQANDVSLNRALSFLYIVRHSHDVEMQATHSTTMQTPNTVFQTLTRCARLWHTLYNVVLLQNFSTLVLPGRKTLQALRTSPVLSASASPYSSRPRLEVS